MAWWWLPIQTTDGDTERQFQCKPFLNQIIHVLDACVDLWNWQAELDSGDIGFMLPLGVVIAEDVVQDAVPGADFFGAVQQRIEDLVYVMVSYSEIENDDAWNGDNDNPHIGYNEEDWVTAVAYVIGDGVYVTFRDTQYICKANHSSKEPGVAADWEVYWDEVKANPWRTALANWNPFKTLANAVGDFPVEHHFDYDEKSIGWRREGVNEAPLFGQVVAGDVINIALLNQIYAACVVLQNFAVLVNASHRHYNTDTSDSKYYLDPDDMSNQINDLDPPTITLDTGYTYDLHGPDTLFADDALELPSGLTIEQQCANVKGQWSDKIWGKGTEWGLANGSNTAGASATYYGESFSDETLYGWKGSRWRGSWNLTDMPLVSKNIKEFGRLYTQEGEVFEDWPPHSGDATDSVQKVDTQTTSLADWPGQLYSSNTTDPVNDTNNGCSDTPLNGAHGYRIAPWVCVQVVTDDPEETEPS
jgi:hypothetical protein